MIERIQHFIAKVGGDPRAIDDLMRYRAEDRDRFAIIKVSGECLEGEHLDQLVDSLAFLNFYNLSPIVLLGGGKQYNAAVQDSVKVGGLRVTNADTLEKVLAASEQNLRNVVDRLTQQRVHAYGVEGIFKVVKHPAVRDEPSGEMKDLGYVGQVVDADFDKVSRQIKNVSGIPVIRPIGYDAHNQPYNINADHGFGGLAQKSGIYKLVMVSGTPVKDADGHVINEVNLRLQYKNLVETGTVHSGMKVKLDTCYKLLEALGEHYSVQITTPANMLKELFGPGIDTKVVLGYNIGNGPLTEQAYTSWVREFLEQEMHVPFKHSYNPVAEGRELFSEERKRSAALVLPNAVSEGEDQIAYMSQLASAIKGNGLGTNTLRVVMLAHPNLFWKSRPDNPFNRVYADNSRWNMDIEVEGRPFKLWGTFNAQNRVGAIQQCVNFLAHRGNDFDYSQRA